MSCARLHQVDWGQLRQESAAAEALRDELRPHLRVCATCRSRALRIDPTLAFGALAPVAVAPDELTVMRQRIAGARRLLESAPAAAPPRAIGARPFGGRAAASLLLPALVLAGLWGGWHVRSGVEPAEPVATAPPPIVVAPHAQALAARLDGLPLIDRAEDSAPEVVYQVEGATFDLVLLVDAGLELGGP